MIFFFAVVQHYRAPCSALIQHCVCVRVCACVRACVHVCVCVRVRVVILSKPAVSDGWDGMLCLARLGLAWCGVVLSRSSSKQSTVLFCRSPRLSPARPLFVDRHSLKNFTPVDFRTCRSSRGAWKASSSTFNGRGGGSCPNFRHTHTLIIILWCITDCWNRLE